MNMPLLVVVGETASGKSTLALQLAQRFNGEIICADSLTIRRGMDIGTAKPTVADRALVPHHLVDIIEPNVVFTAAEFKRLANQAITDISSRGKLSIMVGGTGLYIDSVLFDYQFREASAPSQREQLNQMSLSNLIELAKEQSIDLSSTDVDNPRRLIRLLESNGEQASKRPLRENTYIIGLQPAREQLISSITERVNTMLENGLEAEARVLGKRYGWEAVGLKSIGYAEWKEHESGAKTLDETRKLIIQNTKNLAKRQRTWFRRNKSIHWFNTPVNWQSVVESVTTFLGT